MVNMDISGLAKCGKDVRIQGDVVIRYPELVEIGNHVAIDGPCYISTALIIGDYVHIGPFCSIIGGKKSSCVLDHFSGLSAGCRVICGSDDYLGSGLTNPTIPLRFHADIKYSTVTISKHAVIGTNTVIHPSITIGNGAAVGSCSLVTRDLDPWGVYMGIPAKFIKERIKGRILQFESELRETEGTD